MTYHANIFNHKSKLAVTFKANTWPELKQLIVKEIDDVVVTSRPQGFSVVVWVGCEP